MNIGIIGPGKYHPNAPFGGFKMSAATAASRAAKRGKATPNTRRSGRISPDQVPATAKKGSVMAYVTPSTSWASHRRNIARSLMRWAWSFDQNRGSICT
jgi:hypothetical protein